MTSLGNKSEKGSILREREAITWQEVVGSGCGEWNCLLAKVNPRESKRQSNVLERDDRLCALL